MQEFCISTSAFMKKDFPKKNPYNNNNESTFQSDIIKLAKYNNYHKGIIEESIVDWALKERICRDSLKWFLEEFCEINDKEFLDWIYTEVICYTFYCDETNNNLKFKFKDKKGNLNSDIENDFVLGGIAYVGENPPADIDELFEKFSLQANVKDVKLKHLIKKDKNKSKFEYILTSKKISLLFDWLLENSVFVQFSSINILYFSLVDIIDSIIGLPKEMLDEMKNVLFECVMADREYFLEYLARYGYPHISEDKVLPFCEEFIDWIESIEIDDPMQDFYLEMTRQQMKECKREKQIIYLTNRQKNVLIENYKSVYYTRLVMFKNSMFYFDEISEIQEGFEEQYSMIYQDEECGKYNFLKSDDIRWLQLADIVVGIIGAFLTFANTFEEQDICEKANAFDETSRENLVKFWKIINKAVEENQIFHSYSACYREINRCRFIFRIAELLDQEMRKNK